jgi:hypothetical protein
MLMGWYFISVDVESGIILLYFTRKLINLLIELFNKYIVSCLYGVLSLAKQDLVFSFIFVFLELQVVELKL